MPSNQELEKMLEVIEDPNSGFDGASIETVSSPFPIRATEYLEYAEEDLKENSTRAIVNALSNSKRSLDCRTEEILYAYGLRSIAKKSRWNVPKKLEVLSEIGIVAPRILKKLNIQRNIIEHEFHKPNREKVEDFVDVVSLFSESTKCHLFGVQNDGAILLNPEIIDDSKYFFNFKINREQPEIKVGDKYVLSVEHELYERFVFAYAKLISKYYS